MHLVREITFLFKFVIRWCVWAKASPLESFRKELTIKPTKGSTLKPLAGLHRHRTSKSFRLGKAVPCPANSAGDFGAAAGGFWTEGPAQPMGRGVEGGPLKHQF